MDEFDLIRLIKLEAESIINIVNMDITTNETINSDKIRMHFTLISQLTSPISEEHLLKVCANCFSNIKKKNTLCKCPNYYGCDFPECGCNNSSRIMHSSWATRFHTSFCRKKPTHHSNCSYFCYSLVGMGFWFYLYQFLFGPCFSWDCSVVKFSVIKYSKSDLLIWSKQIMQQCNIILLKEDVVKLPPPPIHQDMNATA